MLYTCTRCGAVSDQRRCPRHRRARNAHRSPNRDRGRQKRFRAAVLARDGHRCTWTDPTTGERCAATRDLRACHVIPLAQLEPDDPRVDDPANGVTRCGPHDRATDPYAR